VCGTTKLARNSDADLPAWQGHRPGHPGRVAGSKCVGRAFQKTGSIKPSTSTRVAGRWCAWATTSAAALSGIEDGIELAQVARADFRAAMQLSARRGHQARIHAARRRLRSMTWLPTTEPVPRTPDSSRTAAWARAQRSRDHPGKRRETWRHRRPVLTKPAVEVARLTDVGHILILIHTYP